MMPQNIIDLIGKKFGKLTVVNRGPNTKHGRTTWLCVCDCNPAVILDKAIPRVSLTDGRIRKSCGCEKKLIAIENGKKAKLHKGIASFNWVFYTYKTNAKINNYEFNISKDFCYKKFQENCFYCGKEPSQIKKGKTFSSEFIYNGLDRYDNALGYVENNIKTSCIICNRLKNTLSIANWNLKLDRIKLKDYNNLMFYYNFEKVSKEFLKLQRNNFMTHKNRTKNKFNTLTEQQYYYLATSNCFYCDEIPSNYLKRDSRDFYQGIDRINSHEGYNYFNCVPACKACNSSKKDYCLSIFIGHLKILQKAVQS